jgi:hypothetical protein
MLSYQVNLDLPLPGITFASVEQEVSLPNDFWMWWAATRFVAYQCATRS